MLFHHWSEASAHADKADIHGALPKRGNRLFIRAASYGAVWAVYRMAGHGRKLADTDIQRCRF